MASSHSRVQGISRRRFLVLASMCGAGGFGVPSKAAPQEREFYGKSWFLADLVQCETYLARRDLVPVCDFAVKAVILDRIKELKTPEVTDNLAVLERVPVMKTDALTRAVREDERVVWISCGTSVGLYLMQKDVHPELADGRLVGIAAASVFNAGYAGLSLHEWRGGKPERLITRFYGGRESS
jgi:hypothetical protein